MKTYAILRPQEEALNDINHDTLYKFKYSKEDKYFYIKVNGHWIEEISTAFNFLSVSK